MDKKYKLTNNSITWFGRTLYQIQAIKSFGVVLQGDLGGYVEKEDNLSHDGDVWVFGDARVFGNALVYGNAQVYGNAEVYGNAQVFGNALVYGNAQVYGNAEVYGDARVYGNARLSFPGNYLVAGPFGEHNRTITIGNNIVNAGRFSGDFNKFKKAVIKKYGDNYGSYARAIQIIETLKF